MTYRRPLHLPFPQLPPPLPATFDLNLFHEEFFIDLNTPGQPYIGPEINPFKPGDLVDWKDTDSDAETIACWREAYGDGPYVVERVRDYKPPGVMGRLWEPPYVHIVPTKGPLEGPLLEAHLTNIYDPMWHRRWFDEIGCERAPSFALAWFKPVGGDR